MKVPVSLAIVALVYSGCVKDPDLNEAEKVSITSITPASGPAGTRVVIKGAHFGVDPSDNTVRFNNDSAAVLTASLDSLIVQAPANGTTGPVTVAVAGNTATGPVFTYTTDSVVTADSVDVYISAPAYGVVYWKNGQEVFLASTQNNIGGAYGLAVSDTNIYVGGFTTFNVYPGSEAAYWKNGNKVTLSTHDSAGEVRALVLSGNDLYVGGSEHYYPVYWKNGVKHSLPTASGQIGRVHALAINGSDVYAAGYEAGPNNESRLVYWKNGIETILGRQGLTDVVTNTIAINGNDVYVCGTDSGNAVYWKNGVRVVLEKYSGDPLQATAIAIVNNSVYVTGQTRDDAVYWKDGVKTTLPHKGYSAAATTITFYKSDIYIGGWDGSSPAYWKNGVRSTLCCQDGYVSSIVVVKKR